MKQVLANRIDWLLQTLFQTQMSACSILEISALSQLYRYINHKSLPSFENLQRAGHLGINLNWLINGEGPQWTDSANARKVQALLASGSKITIEYYYRELAAPATSAAPSQTQPHKDLP